MAVTISGSTGIDKVVDGSIATVDIADDAVTLAKMAPGTDGNLITYDASQNPAYVATGTAGQLLTSAGTGAPPTFTTVSSGGVSLLGTIATTSGTSLALASVNLSLYNKVFFNFAQVSPATGSSILRISINGAATLDLGTAIANDRALFGELMLDLNSNVMNFSQSSPSGTPITTGNATDGASEKNFLYQVQTNLKSLTSVPLTFTWSTGHAFDNGRILVYGLK